MYINLKTLFTEEFLSTIFSFVLILLLLFGIYKFFSQKYKRPQITQEAAQTTAQIPSQDGPYEPVETYTIKPGDTLHGITIELYKDPIYQVLIEMENGIQDPDLIIAGDFLKLPSKELLVDFTNKVKGQILTGVSIKALTDKTYKVVKGDTLWYICERRYGNPNKYPDIAKLNKINNPDHIEPDWQLSLPDL